MSHEVRITETHTYEESLPPLVYRAYCACGWTGWQTFSRADARASHEVHLRTDTAAQRQPEPRQDRRGEGE